MSEAQDNKAVHASVLLAQFNTLRDEIKTRSTAQAALLTANITAIQAAFLDRSAVSTQLRAASKRILSL